eukprot:Plantae.Rhodophyta-Hildenbrandia_rubra.ctg6440.p1 GENE.Plantae.Rhodophyta-Hildenbrandia_rubra.ctg6440~~Plantae.Rhodophyta-Hildenbrandia_rubra.ctg6440.p1  ORF type:complete len:422 (-),score=76.61 Plantae.Rhodophyta-Hildenbrandia_rubra.ctg6440:134-1399(-)
MLGTIHPAFLSPLPGVYPSSSSYNPNLHSLISRRSPRYLRSRTIQPCCKAKRQSPDPASSSQSQRKQKRSRQSNNKKPNPPVANDRTSKSENSNPSSSPAVGRVKRALGSSREEDGPTLPTVDTNLTREDFIKEGIVDDVEAMGGKGSLFVPEDIRYGIRDYKNPFEGKQSKNGGVDGLGEAKTTGDEEGRKGRGVSVAGVERNLTGDGGVVKTIVEEGSGAVVATGAEVVVDYVGKLENGKKFDASGDRSKDGFKFVLGKGKVIKGWDVGVAAMRLGEKATLKIAPKYAYGTRGVPPVIPSKATLTFDIKLLSASEVQEKVPRTVAGYNPGVPRTPEDISAAYEKKMDDKSKEKKKTWLEQIYIISPFASQTGKRPPWFLNPNITFFIVFAIVGAAFYLVYISGGIHQGFVEDVDVNIFK